MPADVSFQHVSQSSAPVEAAPGRRYSLGIGLTIAACVSGGLWFAVAAGVRALFF